MSERSTSELCPAPSNLGIHDTLIIILLSSLTKLLSILQEDIDIDLSSVSPDEGLSKDVPKKETEDPKQTLQTLLQRQAKFLENCREIKVFSYCIQNYYRYFWSWVSQHPTPPFWGFFCLLNFIYLFIYSSWNLNN